MNDEADFSAEQPGACAPSRIPGADGNGRRPQRPARPPRARPQEAVGLKVMTARRDFLAANAGKRAPMPGFVLLQRARDDGDPAKRFGITVTKKIGNAVVRNRMKRRFRALLRDLLPHAGVAGADYVMIGRAGGVERDFTLLQTELAKALAKLAR
jgi:ribonuclease P protein component